MVRLRTIGPVLAAILSSVACSGGAKSPTSASPPVATPSGVTIEIRSTSNAQSFAPNPAAVTQGGPVTWRNADGVTHRIVTNDGSFDSGDIAPGATSRSLTLSRGTNYHCTLHTAMVGAIGIEMEPPPPCTGPYC